MGVCVYDTVFVRMFVCVLLLNVAVDRWCSCHAKHSAVPVSSDSLQKGHAGVGRWTPHRASNSEEIPFKWWNTSEILFQVINRLIVERTAI